MQMRAALGILGAALFFWAPSSVLADVVEMPMSCPEGSSNAFCHGPATCAPRGCVSSTDCDVGEVCVARDLCIETHECFGFPSSFVSHVLGACDGPTSCPSPGSCQGFFVCAPGTPSIDAGSGMDAGALPEHVTACACRAGGHGGSTGVLVAMLAVLALSASRRR
jgi:MYXO-CTERM domain-containing protein